MKTKVNRIDFRPIPGVKQTHSVLKEEVNCKTYQLRRIFRIQDGSCLLYWLLYLGRFSHRSAFVY